MLVILTTLAITLCILNMNYVEDTQRKKTKKHTILNHWGKHKPNQHDLDKLKIEWKELEEHNNFEKCGDKPGIVLFDIFQEEYPPGTFCRRFSCWP